MGAKTYTVKGLNKALKSLPALAKAELRQASLDIAELVADDARQRARLEGGLGMLVAPSIVATRDSVPRVKEGSAKKLPAHSDGRARTGARQTVGDVMWGAEFGGGRRPTTRQFRPWRGSGSDAGYILYPAVRRNAERTGELYSEALDAALQEL